MLESGFLPEVVEVPTRILSEYVGQIGVYPVHRVEMNGDPHARVIAFAVVRIKRGEYRAVAILQDLESEHPQPYLAGFESDKIAVGHWLRTKGVPVSRIGEEQ